MTVNGHPKNQQTFSRVCGYVEQVRILSHIYCQNPSHLLLLLHHCRKNKTNMLLLVCRMIFMRPAQQCTRRWSSQLRCASWVLTRTSSRTLWIRWVLLLTCKPSGYLSTQCIWLLRTDAVHAVHTWSFDHLVCDCAQSRKKKMCSCACLCAEQQEEVLHSLCLPAHSL